MLLIPHDDPLLSTKLEPFNFSEHSPEEVEDLSKELVDFMWTHRGLGLSANQVGLHHRVFVMRGVPNFVCFNPRVVNYSEEQVVLEEGCLSFPGLYIKIKRPRNIRVRFQGPDGEVYTREFKDMTARVFQHELDHLDGVNFVQRASRFHRESAMKKYEAALRRQKRTKQ